MSKTTRLCAREPGRGFRLMLLSAALVVGGAASLPASAQAHHGGPGMAGPGMGGPGMMMGNPEQMGRMTDRMLEGLNATDAQREQIKKIAAAAATDLRAQREAGRALHEKGMQIFAAPTVDAAAAEALRQQMLAQHDVASKRMLQAMLEISAVLTPEQRSKLVERMKQRGEMAREHMRRPPSSAASAPKQ